MYLLENSRSFRAVLAVRFARYPDSPQSATETWTGVEFVGLETRLAQNVVTEIQVLFLPWVPQIWLS